MKLHEAMIEVLNRHGGGWMDRDLIAKEIASGSLFVRPSDGLPPPSDQLRLRARHKSYAQLFECSDTRCSRIRLASPRSTPTTFAQLRGDTQRALAGDAVRRRSEHASGRVGGRANTLKRLLALAGRTVEPAQFDRPRLNMLPQHLRTEVLDIYQGFGGVQAEPQLYPGSWDAGCDGIAVELDEDLHFNQYRGRTLRQPSYAALPNFPTKLYICMCTRHEAQCLSKGRSQARWTSPSTEKQFGPAAPRGDLTGNGAPRWKQRALYDFMKDLAPLVGLGTVARVSVWDAVPLRGSDVLVDRVLRGVAEKEAAMAVSRLIDARATGSPG